MLSSPGIASIKIFRSTASTIQKQGSHGSLKSLKVLDFCNFIFKAWKVLENGHWSLKSPGIIDMPHSTVHIKKLHIMKFFCSLKICFYIIRNTGNGHNSRLGRGTRGKISCTLVLGVGVESH